MNHIRTALAVTLLAALATSADVCGPGGGGGVASTGRGFGGFASTPSMPRMNFAAAPVQHSQQHAALMNAWNARARQSMAINLARLRTHRQQKRVELLAWREEQRTKRFAAIARREAEQREQESEQGGFAPALVASTR